jgi:hypothetical protein
MDRSGCARDGTRLRAMSGHAGRDEERDRTEQTGTRHETSFEKGV